MKAPGLFEVTEPAKERRRVGRLVRLAAVRLDAARLGVRMAMREGDYVQVAARARRMARAAGTMAAGLRRLGDAS